MQCMLALDGEFSCDSLAGAESSPLFELSDKIRNAIFQHQHHGRLGLLRRRQQLLPMGLRLAICTSRGELIIFLKKISKIKFEAGVS